MQNQNVARAEQKLPLDWTNISFLTLVTGGAIASIFYYWLGDAQVNPHTITLAWWMFFLTGLSITVGYHRCISHRAFKVKRPIWFLFLFFGPGSSVGSARDWPRNHRDHHDDPEGPRDRYRRRKTPGSNRPGGFWWSHEGAVLHKDPNPDDYSSIPDLEKDWMVQLQHKYFVPLMLFVTIVLPCAIAGLGWGDALGAFRICFLIRVAIQLQLIFCVNSVAHTFGRRTFNATQSACDNVVANAVLSLALATCIVLAALGYWSFAWDMTKIIFALATCGEILGHGYHHEYPGDYRNYPRWWYLDPSRWVINILRLLRLASDVHPPPSERIEQIFAAAAK